MVNYHHRQTGWVMLLAIGAAALVQVILFGALASVLPAMAFLVAVAVVAVIGLIAWIGSSLTVDVTDSEVVWYFGPGLWQHRIARADIATSAPVRNKWWYGYGMRYFGRGSWLYNVSGLDAVEIRLKDGRWRRIGTDDPQDLAAALQGKGR